MDEALHTIASLFGTSFDVIEPHLETALTSAADPERSLVYLERMLEKRDNSILAELVKNPRVIESMVTIFSGSQFLAEILLRNPQNVNLVARAGPGRRAGHHRPPGRLCAGGRGEAEGRRTARRRRFAKRENYL